VGQEGEGANIREKEANMDIEEEREYSSPITGEIENPTEDIVQVEENETP
jgi:hypothetical protein